MLPFRHQSIFRSRWMALLWAGLVLWSAWQVAAPDATPQDGAAPSDVTGAPIDQAQVDALEDAINGM